MSEWQVPAEVMARFEAKYEVAEGGCWLWTAAKQGKGYGSFFYKKTHLAHRFSYETHVGPIPEGLDLDHLCRVRHCVNPEHLEPVTRKENVNRGELAEMMRAKNLLKTHCKAGHEFTDENTRRWTNKRGSVYRFCRTCARSWQRDYQNGKNQKRSKA